MALSDTRVHQFANSVSLGLVTAGGRSSVFVLLPISDTFLISSGGAGASVSESWPGEVVAGGLTARRPRGGLFGQRVDKVILAQHVHMPPYLDTAASPLLDAIIIKTGLPLAVLYPLSPALLHLITPCSDLLLSCALR